MRANQLTLTKEDCEKAILMRSKGIKVDGITRYFIVSEATLRRYLHHHGLFEQWRSVVGATTSKPNVGNTKEIPFFWLYHRRFNWGWTYEQIAADFGCSAGKVQNAMRRHGFIGMEEER